MIFDETIPAALAGERLDRVVALIADVSRSQASRLIGAESVTVDGALVTDRKSKLALGQRVQIDTGLLDEAVRPGPDASVSFEVVHADDVLIVVDKPAGLVVHPGAGHPDGTLVNGLLARFPDLVDVGEPDRPGIVHRLDAGSSGLLVVARTTDALADLAAQFRDRRAGRTYQAMVWGHPEATVSLIDAPIGRSPRDPLRRAVVVNGKPARTHYRVVGRLGGPADLAELVCTLETGRTHQIRVHLASVGHPLVGDTLYGTGRPVLGLARPYLHAAALTVDHPATGERLTWKSELPGDLQSFRATLVES